MILPPPPLGTNIALGNVYDNTDSEKVVLRGRAGTQMANRVRYRREPIPAGKNISYPQDKTMSSESEMMVEPPIRVTPPVIGQDTYLDNEIGTAMCGAKAKFGKPHFIEAYQRMLKTSKKLDDEWEKYLEEEVDW